MHEDVLEYGDPVATVRMQTHHKLKIGGSVVAYRDAGIAYASCCNISEEECCMCKSYQRNVHKDRTNPFEGKFIPERCYYRQFKGSYMLSLVHTSTKDLSNNFTFKLTKQCCLYTDFCHL